MFDSNTKGYIFEWSKMKTPALWKRVAFMHVPKPKSTLGIYGYGYTSQRTNLDTFSSSCCLHLHYLHVNYVGYPWSIGVPTCPYRIMPQSKLFFSFWRRRRRRSIMDSMMVGRKELRRCPRCWRSWYGTWWNSSRLVHLQGRELRARRHGRMAKWPYGR